MDFNQHLPNSTIMGFQQSATLGRGSGGCSGTLALMRGHTLHCRHPQCWCPSMVTGPPLCVAALMPCIHLSGF